jgi:3-deoxy-D-manno-octulosonate 8-phosphate phosphatase (KDO 8-P phosphatase)
VITEDIRKRASQIKLLLADVDGVFTDGRIYFGNQDEEFRAFHVQDGLGVKLLKRCGIEVGVITAKNASLVKKRMESLGMTHIYQGQEDKLAVLEMLLPQLKLSPDAVAYIGDDLPDIAIFSKVGLGIAVANANPLVKSYAHWQTTAHGGYGAVREVCDLILTTQDKFPYLLDYYEHV